MASMLTVITLLALTAGMVRGDIQWPEGCDTYQVTPVGKPAVWRFHFEVTNGVAQCQALCTGRTECGGFAVDYTLRSCELYNINDDVMADHFNSDWFNAGYSRFSWYSKTCEYELVVSSDELGCVDYSHVHPNKYINSASQWKISHVNSILGLTPTQCHHWCSLHLACRSVSYSYSFYSESGGCVLFTTTIPVLEVLGLDWPDGVLGILPPESIIASYDRWCGDQGPYIPNAVSQ